jgi:3-oxoacyl-[acyl-carrier protein] reductase
MDLGINGKTAVVCSGSAGLGRGTASALAADGVTVYIAARDKERLETAARDIVNATGGKVHAVQPDATTDGLL